MNKFRQIKKNYLTPEQKDQLLKLFEKKSGIPNIGNSCFFNTASQIVFKLEPFKVALDNILK